MAQAVNVQQNLVPGVQNLNLNDDKTPLMSAPQVSNVQAEYPQTTPPPFLSGVPMVNPVGYAATGVPSGAIGPANPQQQAAQEIISTQQPISQTQSVVSNMAAYSSSKFLCILFIQFSYVSMILNYLYLFYRFS